MTNSRMQETWFHFQALKYKTDSHIRRANLENVIQICPNVQKLKWSVRPVFIAYSEIKDV